MKFSTSLSVQSLVWVAYMIFALIFNWGTEYFLFGLGASIFLSGISQLTRVIEDKRVSTTSN